MDILIKKSVANGTVLAPPSKSVAHRTVICGALAGNSQIKNIGTSDDITATVDCLKALGFNIENNGESVKTLGYQQKSEAVLNCNESGSTLRFLIPVAMCLCSKVTFIGSQKLFSRPLSAYEQIFKEQKIDYTLSKNSLTVCGKFTNSNFKVCGNISSQFISGLLFALPLMGGGSVEVTGKISSKPYIDLTVQEIKSFGVNIQIKDNIYTVIGTYKPNNKTVEGDYSATANLHIFNYFGGNVTVNGLNENSLQGDKIYFDLFKKLQEKQEINIDLCPDLGPVLFAFAALIGGGTICGTDRLKLKESDRILSMKTELKKFNVNVKEGKNCVKITGKALSPSGELYGHNDHRIVMALSVLLTFFGGKIKGAEAVKKSFPNFFDCLKALGVEYEVK